MRKDLIVSSNYCCFRFKDLKMVVICLSKRSDCEIVTLMILSDDFKVVYRWSTLLIQSVYTLLLLYILQSICIGLFS